MLKRHSTNCSFIALWQLHVCAKWYPQEVDKIRYYAQLRELVSQNAIKHTVVIYTSVESAISTLFRNEQITVYWQIAIRCMSLNLAIFSQFLPERDIFGVFGDP